MKTVDDYMALNWSYSIELEQYKDRRYYIIRVNEFPGICTDNESLEKGMEDIKDILAATIEWYLKDGLEVPCPVDKNEYKGKILYRTDANTHYNIAKAAKRNNISLNKCLDMVVHAGLNQLQL